MKIENNRFASLIYTLHEGDANGRILEKVEISSPLTFVFGTGRLLPAFESNLEGLEEGSTFGFRLPAADAYGERREEMIVSLPRTIFEDDGVLNTTVCFEGNTVPMMDAHGNRMNGVVTEIADSFVRMDFNHPLAGTDLYFSGTITGVREATAEEIMPPASGCSTCGSKSSGCDGSCS